MSRFRLLSLIGVTALSLSACQTMSGMTSSLSSAFDLPAFDMSKDGRVTVIPQGNCPAVNRVAELSSLYQFSNPARPDTASELSEGHVARVSSTCVRQGNNLKVTINLGFDSALGPKGRINPGDKPSFAYPYFVAITNTKNQILSKEIFAVSFSYNVGINQLSQNETVTQIVPLDGADPTSYHMLIGFQLSPEELAYNRKLPLEQLGKNLTAGTLTTGQ